MSTATQEPKTTSRKVSEIRPPSDRLVVRRPEAESMTAGGIVLRDKAKEKPKGRLSPSFQGSF